MSQEYVFEFPGKKDDFLNVLKEFRNHNYDGEVIHYINDYIVKIVDGKIHFGVERAGHSGGYWFIPTITEFDDRMELRGTVEYVGPSADKAQSVFRKVIEKIEMVLLFILAMPILLIVGLYKVVEWCIRKICNRPKQKEKTTEEKLFDLMENHLGCVRK